MDRNSWKGDVAEVNGGKETRELADELAEDSPSFYQLLDQALIGGSAQAVEGNMDWEFLEIRPSTPGSLHTILLKGLDRN